MSNVSKLLRKLDKTWDDKYFTEHIPDLFDYKTMLYIGIEEYRMVMIKNFLKHNYIIDVLEIWKPHVEYYQKMNKVIPMFRKIIHADVRRVDAIELPKYDVILWFHGPEHINKKELKKTFDGLKERANKLFVTACPYGDSHSPPRGGNKYNLHLSELYPEDLKALDMTVVNDKNKRIKAWWRRSKK